MKEKLSISMLPCNRSVSLFFYGGIVCSVLFKILEKVAPAITFLVLLLGGICNFVFMYFFAKGCKPLQKNLYSLFLQNASTNLLICIIYPFFKYFLSTTSLVVLSLALIYSLVVYILITITLCKNFTGELGTLGRAMWLFPSILFIVLIGLIIYKVGEYNQTFGTIIGILGFGSLVVVIIGFIEIPCRMLKMLNNGYTSNLTDEEFQNQLREMGYYRDSSLKSCSSSFKVSNPLTSSFSKINKEHSIAKKSFNFKNPDVSKKIVIVTSSVVLGLLIGGGTVFFINQHNKNEKANYRVEEEKYNEEYIDEVAEPIEDPYLNEHGNETEVASNQVELPSWVPADVLSIFGMENKLTMGTYESLCTSLLRYSNVDLLETNIFEGYINEYPVKVIMKIDRDGNVSGRYAYESTLNRYGDNPKSWFPIKGVIVFDSNSSPYLFFQDRNPADDKIFEYALLKYNGGDSWSGNMINVKYLTAPESHHLHNIRFGLQ